MPKKFLRRILPDFSAVEKLPLSRYFGPHLQRTELWRIEREPVARGLALGLACGMIPGPLQMLAAFALACWCRVNLPIALAATFFTNPLTIVPLYLLAWQIGQSVTPGAQTGDSFQMPPAFDWQTMSQSMQNYGLWLLDLGTPWLIGLVLLALAISASAYLLLQLIWRLWRYQELRSAHKKRRHTQQAYANRV